MPTRSSLQEEVDDGDDPFVGEDGWMLEPWCVSEHHPPNSPNAMMMVCFGGTAATKTTTRE